MSEKVHGGEERHIVKTAILVVSLGNVLNWEKVLGKFGAAAESAGGGGMKRLGGGYLKLPFPLRNAGENQSLEWQGWVIS